MNRRPRETGRVRIIGGRWRGRKLRVAASPAMLRPSPDRVRETLFNWLAPYLSGARCLDVFAGTGVLGFEALSRGAAAAILLEQDAAACACLEEHREALETTDATIVHTDALAWLERTPPEPCDIVFVDPPFRQGLIPPVLARLRAGWLKPRALVYLEAEKIPILDLEAAGWQRIREGRTRHTEFALVEAAAR